MSASGGTNPKINFVDQALVKQTPKERAKNLASGQMPDDWDYENIRKAVEIYKKRNPGELQMLIADVRKEVSMSDIGYNANLTTNDDKAGKLIKRMWLPTKMFQWMEIAYPTIVYGANERHVQWFLRKFPAFDYLTYTKAVKRK